MTTEHFPMKKAGKNHPRDSCCEVPVARGKLPQCSQGGKGHQHAQQSTRAAEGLHGAPGARRGRTSLLLSVAGRGTLPSARRAREDLRVPEELAYVVHRPH